MSGMDENVLEQLKAKEKVTTEELREIVETLPSMIGRKVSFDKSEISVKMVTTGYVTTDFFDRDPVGAFSILLNGVAEETVAELNTQRQVLAELIRLQKTSEEQNEQPANV